MSVPSSVAEILKGHVTLELESIDRVYCGHDDAGWVISVNGTRVKSVNADSEH